MNEKLNLVINEIEPNHNKPINKSIKQKDVNISMSEDDVKISLNKNKYVSELIFKYNTSNYQKYAHLELLAIDKLCGGGKKLYLGFKNKADKVKFIKSYKYNNLYEILTNEYVKPYFDIDYKKEDEHKTDDDVKKILNAFITEFNKFFKLPITSNNLYVYAKRDDETNKIKSIHIVVSGFQTTKAQLKECVKEINKQRKKTSFKKLVGGLDGTVYNKRKLFSLPHQRKLGKTEYFDWFYCFDNDESKYGEEAIYHYLINDVKNCVFNSYYDNPQEYVKCITQNIITKEETVDKLNKIITNDEMIKLNPTNVVDKLLEHLPQEFFAGDGWKNISRQIVLNKFNGYDKWLAESVERASGFDVDKNRAWADKLDDKYATTDITKHLNVINNEYDLCFIWDKSGYYTQELMDWICKIANINQSDLKLIIKLFNEAQAKCKKKIPTNEIIVGNNYIFDVRKQTLINEITQSINHFGMETNFNNQYGIDGSKFKTIKQEDIITEMNMFLKSLHRVSGWKMLWGSGKSYYGVNTIKKYAMDNGYRILFITPNNNLNIEMTASLGGISHLDIKNGKLTKEDVSNSPILISSLESLYSTIHLNDEAPIDIIIFDEFESIINNFISNTFKTKTAFEVSELLSKLLCDASKIICLDCDLSEIRLNIFKNVLKDETNENWNIQLYNCDYNSWKDYKYIIHTGVKPMRQSLHSDVFENNKRVLYSTNSINDATTIFRELLRKERQIAEHKNIMLISSEGVEYFVNGELYNCLTVADWISDKNDMDINNTQALIKINKKLDIGKYATRDKKALFDNTEQTLKELQIQVLVYSPSMTCGISFGNSKTDFMFDKLYGSSSIGSITAREFLQMIHRCRNLKDGEINLYIKNGLTAITPLISLDTCEILYMRHKELKLCDKTDKKDDWWGEIDDEKFKQDPFYKDIVVSDMYEKFNSERNYIQELLGKLIVNHKMNVSIKHIYKLSETETSTVFKEDYDAIKKLVNADKKMLLQQEPKITENQYKQFKDDMNRNDGKDNRQKVNKYFILNCLNINKSNNDILLKTKDAIDYQQEDRYWCVEKDLSNGEITKRVMNLKSDDYGASSGVFKNYSLDADDEIYYFNNHDINKYYIIKDADQQHGYWCVYVNKWGRIIKRELKQESDITAPKSGLFKHHIINGDKKEIYYYGGGEKELDDIDDSDNIDDYCDLEDIYVEPYDKDLLIQHSKKLADIYKSPHTERLYRFNNDILTGNINPNEVKTNAITNKDYNLNKSKIIKDVIDMLGINRKDLIYTRKIISNLELKKILQDNSTFIENELIIFYNKMDTEKLNATHQDIKKYNSSNTKHFKYVKDIITTYMSWVGISNSHYNKHGKRGLYVYSDDCLNAFQYELYGNFKITNHYGNQYSRTFINTYYEPIQDEIYYYIYKSQKLIHTIINQKTLDDNMMATGKANKYKRVDKKFQERRNIIYKRNRYITITIQDTERRLKLPFNLMTAKYIADKNYKYHNYVDFKDRTKDESDIDYNERWDIHINHLIDLTNKTDAERIDIYVGLTQDDYEFPIQKYDITNYKKTKDDTPYYKYKDVGWKRTDDKLYYIKEQVAKYTPNKNTEDKIIEVKQTQTTEDQVNNVLNDMIDEIVFKDDFKTMVNTEINVGGEINKISEAHNILLRDEIDTSQFNSNDNHINILRPNIRIIDKPLIAIESC